MSDVTRDEFDKLQRQVEENTKRLAQGDKTLGLIDYRLQEIDKKLDGLDARVAEMQKTPARRWETLSQTILQWVVTALLTFIAVKIGIR